jgi:outer membrane protein assembly factor BamB
MRSLHKSIMIAAALAALAGSAYAITTRQFKLDSAGVLSDGKLEGTAVLSSGAVVPSVGTRRVALANVPVARCLLARSDGTALIGTGNDGKIWKLSGDSAAVFAETGEALVAAMVAAPDGTVYAGTLPKGKIFAIDKQGKAKLFAQPKDAEDIWALAYDAKKSVLFAGTGPQGKVFAIDKKGKVEDYYSGGQSHVMTLVLAPTGALYAGTADDALLLRIDGPGRADVVYDFEGNEVTALALRDGRLAVAANQFPRTPKKSDAKKDDDKSDDKSDASKDAPKPGTGELWAVEASGQARKLWASSEGHITAVQWADQDRIYAATGKGGRIYRVEQDGTSALWIDVEERQVLDMDLVGKDPLFVTGDAGAVYRVLPGPASEALWTSKVLDARFLSRWGALSWRGEGKLSLQTRSGNTDKPDERWSEWSSVLTAPGPIRSPSGRFLQIRARLDARAPSILYAVQAYYLPGNQPASLKDISVKPTPGKGGADDAPSTVYRIEWKADNPDDDKLRYRLQYRPEGHPDFRPILKESEILTKTSYDWSTDGVPDGYYRVRIDASDELDNPAHAVLVQHQLSEPFLLDNHPPHVENLSFSSGKLKGLAWDTLGPISSLEIAVDAQDFVPFYPVDDLFDTAREPFELELKDLSKGRHALAVRCKDARNNVTTAELWIELK